MPLPRERKLGETEKVEVVRILQETRSTEFEEPSAGRGLERHKHPWADRRPQVKEQEESGRP